MSHRYVTYLLVTINNGLKFSQLIFLHRRSLINFDWIRNDPKPVEKDSRNPSKQIQKKFS